MGDPCVRLDLFPLDGPASLLRWGALEDDIGGLWFTSPYGLGFYDINEDWSNRSVEGNDVEVPLRGTALDALARSMGVALGWPVEEDGPAPVFRRHTETWFLRLGYHERWFFTVPGISALPYAAALLAAAEAVAREVTRG